MAWVLFCLLLAMAAFQAVFALWFAGLLFRTRPARGRDEELPHVSILLPLRGADPGLANSVARLLRQDYPRFDLRIIVDSEQDPAWDVVRRAAESLGAENVNISAIRQRHTTCSLQCSALSQAVSDLDDKCEVVVTVDGDLAAHSSCLRELVTPLLDDRIGLTFGNRWFMPPDAGWGSWVRYLWNAAAVVPMYVFGIPWGGCFAIRRAALLESGLAESWRRVMVHDAPAKGLLRRDGWRVRFVPSLMMINRDRCSLSFAHDFIKRQMLWTRLYHPNFGPVLLHAVATSLVFGMAIILASIGLANGDFWLTVWAGGGFAAYLGAMLLLMAVLESAVRQVLKRRGEAATRYRLAALCRLPVAIPLTQLVYLSAILLATFRREVTWRGVRYAIRAPFDVAVLSDQPFEVAADHDHEGSNVSL